MLGKGCLIFRQGWERVPPPLYCINTSNLCFFILIFKDAVGAINKTHIPASVPSVQQMAYTNRHRVQSQNVLAIYDHDMRLEYVYTDWEGSARDVRILNRILTGPNYFPMPSPGII